MKNLAFTIIPCGWGENDPGYLFFGYKYGTYDDKYKQREWRRFPISCVLIHHPTAGYILYDTGCGLGEDKDRRPPEHRNANPVFIKREEYIDQRLKLVGLTVHDISHIIISHGHWDHIGGLEFFKGTKAIQNVYINEKEFAHALVNSHKSGKGYSDTVYYKRNLDVDGAEFKLLDGDTQLFPGVELIMMDSHTPGTMGLVLHLDSSTYIFPNDEIAASLNYHEPIMRPGSIYNSLGFTKVLDRIRRLERQYDATIIFSHDPWRFPEYKTIPEWYQ